MCECDLFSVTGGYGGKVGDMTRFQEIILDKTLNPTLSFGITIYPHPKFFRILFRSVLFVDVDGLRAIT